MMAGRLSTIPFHTATRRDGSRRRFGKNQAAAEALVELGYVAGREHRLGAIRLPHDVTVSFSASQVWSPGRPRLEPQKGVASH